VQQATLLGVNANLSTDTRSESRQCTRAGTSNIGELERQVNLLKSTVARLRGKLGEKAETILDLRTEIQQLKGEMEAMEKESDEKDELLNAKTRDVEQYRNWWLNEVQFMKLLLNKIPEPNRDVDLVRTSQAHYLGHY
jgi:peptidoglycan hydrolase CwlO-like protein